MHGWLACTDLFLGFIGTYMDCPPSYLFDILAGFSCVLRNQDASCPKRQASGYLCGSPVLLCMFLRYCYIKILLAVWLCKPLWIIGPSNLTTKEIHKLLFPCLIVHGKNLHQILRYNKPIYKLPPWFSPTVE
jgi:hypothetical protein